MDSGELQTLVADQKVYKAIVESSNLHMTQPSNPYVNNPSGYGSYRPSPPRIVDKRMGQMGSNPYGSSGMTGNTHNPGMTTSMNNPNMGSGAFGVNQGPMSFSKM